MTPKEELQYLQGLVAAAETISTLADGQIEEHLSALVCDKIGYLVSMDPEEETS